MSNLVVTQPLKSGQKRKNVMIILKRALPAAQEVLKLNSAERRALLKELDRIMFEAVIKKINRFV
jgi:hypothetical protein